MKLEKRDQTYLLNPKRHMNTNLEDRLVGCHMIFKDWQ
jgi:hypothetical protein